MKKYGPLGLLENELFTWRLCTWVLWKSHRLLGYDWCLPLSSRKNLVEWIDSLHLMKTLILNSPCLWSRSKGYSSIMLFSIQAQYQLIDGATRLGKKFGGTGGTLTIIKFEDDKETLSIEGNSVVDRISQLTFVSRRNNISSPTLYNGPFGWQPLWSDYVAHACKIQRILMQLLSLLTHHSCVKGSSSP